MISFTTMCLYLFIRMSLQIKELVLIAVWSRLQLCVYIWLYECHSKSKSVFLLQYDIVYNCVYAFAYTNVTPNQRACSCWICFCLDFLLCCLNTRDICLAFDFCRFCVVIQFFHPRHNGQWLPTSKDFLSHILSITFIFLFQRKSQYFPFWMVSAKQGHYWYHFYNVFGMTRSLTGDWTRDLPHSKPVLYH